MSVIKTIIWDWNGTLIDDLHICLQSINQMLTARSLPTINDEEYRRVFTFPVKKYYEAIGFDFEKEAWEPAAIQFIDLYLAALPSCKLTPFATECLQAFRGKSYSQAIISAMQHDELLKSVTHLKIKPYFDYIGGISDHYGAGKIENARYFFAKTGNLPSQTLLIGDTLHDSEVAHETGCRCI